MKKIALPIAVFIMSASSTAIFAQTEGQSAQPSTKQASSPPDPDNVIVVTGTRSARPIKDSPVPVRIVNRAEIEAAGDTTAADAMSRVVGVHMDTAVRTGQTPQIQGFSSKHVLVLIDGRRANGRLADDFDLARIPASSIERIEVLKGASSVLYGSDAIGGVINIITRKPRKGFRGDIQASRDSLHRNEVSGSVTGGGETVTARIDAGHQTAPAYDINPKDIIHTGVGYERNSGQVELRYHATDSLDFITSVASELSTTEAIGAGSRGVILDRTTEARGRTVKVGSVYRPDEAGEIHLELADSQRKYDFLEAERAGTNPDRRIDSNEVSKEASLVASRAFSTSNETVIGVETARHDFESNQMDQGSKERLRSSVFFQHEWKVVPNLSLVPGVRYDEDSQFDGQVSKAFTVRYDLTETAVLRLSYGEGYRAPSFSELYLSFVNQSVGYQVRGNPDLKPERSQSGQANVAWQPSSAIWLSAGVFTNIVRDLIATTRSQPGSVLLVDYANVERVRNRGAEFSSRYAVNNYLNLGLDYTFLEAIDEGRKRTLEGRPIHSGSVQVRYEDKKRGFNSALITGLVGKRPFYTDVATGTTTDWAKSYRSTTLRLGQKIATNYEVFTGVRNLTNESQERLHPVPPRSYFGGVSAEF